jgi:hypothetical protein
MARSHSASAMTIGVLPLPPTVKFPMLTTRTGSRADAAQPRR